MITELAPQTYTLTRAIEISTEALQAFLDAGGEIVANHYGIRVFGPSLKRFEADQLTIVAMADCTLINCWRIRGRAAPKKCKSDDCDELASTGDYCRDCDIEQQLTKMQCTTCGRMRFRTDHEISAAFGRYLWGEPCTCQHPSAPS